MNQFSEEFYNELKAEFVSYLPEIKLAPGTEPEVAKFAVETFAEMVYFFEYAEPKDWKAEQVKEVLGESFPRKVVLDDDVMVQIPAVLISLVELLVQKGKVDESLLEAAKIGGKQLIKDYRNELLWARGKQFAMDASSYGVNLNDEEAIDAFASFKEDSQDDFYKALAGRDKDRKAKAALKKLQKKRKRK